MSWERVWQRVPFSRRTFPQPYSPRIVAAAKASANTASKQAAAAKAYAKTASLQAAAAKASAENAAAQASAGAYVPGILSPPFYPPRITRGILDPQRKSIGVACLVCGELWGERWIVQIGIAIIFAAFCSVRGDVRGASTEELAGAACNVAWRCKSSCPFVLGLVLNLLLRNSNLALI